MDTLENYRRSGLVISREQGLCFDAGFAVLHCTHAMTRARLRLTPTCLLHMYWITWELLFGMVCTPGMAGSASRARAKTWPYHTAFALTLH